MLVINNNKYNMLEANKINKLNIVIGNKLAISNLKLVDYREYIKYYFSSFLPT